MFKNQIIKIINLFKTILFDPSTIYDMKIVVTYLQTAVTLLKYISWWWWCSTSLEGWGAEELREDSTVGLRL